MNLRKIFGIRKPKQRPTTNLTVQEKVFCLGEEFLLLCNALFEYSQRFSQVSGMEKVYLREVSYRDTRFLVDSISEFFYIHTHRDIFSQEEIAEIREGKSHSLKFLCKDFTVLFMGVEFEQLLVQYSDWILKFSSGNHDQIEEEIALIGFRIVDYIRNRYFEATQKDILAPFQEKNQSL